MRKKIYDVLSVSKQKGDLSWWVDIFIISLIVVNVIVNVLESVQVLYLQYQFLFQVFEIFSVVIFSIEYLLRIVTINVDEKYKNPFIGNIKYALSFMALIDLLAILPFYLPFIGLDLRFLRILRLFRIFRLFKINRYTSAMTHINKVVKEKKEELFISLMLTLIMLLITSTLMYYVENDEQPDKFSSIPETLWWGISTFTTVGYGDIYPITPFGKLLGGLISVLGIGLFALPTGILASGFSDQIKKEKISKCPNCNCDLS